MRAGSPLHEGQPYHHHHQTLHRRARYCLPARLPSPPLPARWLFNIASLPPKIRITLVMKLADVEQRLAYGCSEALQLGALVAAFALVRDDIVAAAQ